MVRIALISCSKKKKNKPAPAYKLYNSNLFRKHLEYARAINADLILILSAKYGLLPKDKIIEPYDKNLNQMNRDEIKKWSDNIVARLKNIANLEKDYFIILAGKNYRKHITPYLSNYEVPLEGLGIGEQIGYLTTKIEVARKCNSIHQYFQDLKRFTFPFDHREIVDNGVYVLFEKGENGHGGDRIVQIGTHRGENQLIPRLKQHFVKENKDRSILRKNIGRCFLNRDSDPFLKKWNLDLTSREAKMKHSQKVNYDYQEKIESKVSGYIQGSFTFSVIKVSRQDKRSLLKSRIISTISQCDSCNPSENWLGKHLPKKKIRESGLWQEKELYKKPISDDELIRIFDL